MQSKATNERHAHEPAMIDFLFAGGVAGAVARLATMGRLTNIWKERMGVVVGFPALGCLFYSRTVVPVTQFDSVEVHDILRRFLGGSLAGGLAASIAFRSRKAVLRTMPFFGLQQASYDYLLISTQSAHTPLTFISFGLLAGLFAQSIIYPLERLSHGAPLFRGMTPTFVTVAPAVAVTLTCRDIYLGRAESLY
eukprot:TRINITY_DN1180_c3_g1_i1.p1 TRINITY_DN1180_c3_g1~~TRINITY_DN1180_c3_g1_i1.p1  ORF type:complete len:210 (+),score=14.82 TRINITY_DN1180_c3_g1_i1:49-630(+)